VEHPTIHFRASTDERYFAVAGTRYRQEAETPAACPTHRIAFSQSARCHRIALPREQASAGTEAGTIRPKPKPLRSALSNLEGFAVQRQIVFATVRGLGVVHLPHPYRRVSISHQ
jgi:hypothetical protein